jgi:hypothetical protein
MEGETLVVSVNATTQPYAYPGRAAETVPPLERSRRLNTVLLVIIAMLLMFGALGGTYLYGIVSNLSSTTGAAGAPGNNGAPGSDGSDGSNGANGPAGFPGPDGSDGRNGSDGQDGLDGAAGLNGADGVDGAPGADGVTLYNSGQGVVDLGACDSDVRIQLRSRLDGDVFYLSSITLSDIASECWGSTVDVYALGGSSPNWTTLTEAIGIVISGESIVITADQLSDDGVLSSSIARVALEIR